MNPAYAFLQVLVFPGLLYAVPAGWLMMWLERKVIARLQRRIGPPFLQPLYDFFKLMGKASYKPQGFQGVLASILPILAVVSLSLSLGILPLNLQSNGFAGDLILMVALLEVPAILNILAGFNSNSIFGEIGAVREAVFSLAYNLIFLTAMISLALAGGSFRLQDLTIASTGYIGALAVIAILLCIPARLRLNPFSISNAEQEIYAGALTEYGGAQLALWELAHSLEWVALSGLAASLCQPRSGNAWIDAVIWVAVSLIFVVLISFVAASTARLKIHQAARFYWVGSCMVALLVLTLALLSFRGG